jgi:small subunit ribosomal protein S21
MLNINVKDEGSLDKALKKLKTKVKNTKQRESLRERKEFTKKSQKRRTEKKKAQYVQKLKDKQQS